MMGPISLGFEEARQVSEHIMENLCRNYHEGMTGEELQQVRWCLMDLKCRTEIILIQIYQYLSIFFGLYISKANPECTYQMGQKSFLF